jgi:hypothetical protein
MVSTNTIFHNEHTMKKTCRGIEPFFFYKIMPNVMEVACPNHTPHKPPHPTYNTTLRTLVIIYMQLLKIIHFFN